MHKILTVMNDDMNDAFMLHEFAKEAEREGDLEMHEFYKNRAMARLEEFRKDAEMFEKKMKHGMSEEAHQLGAQMLKFQTDRADGLEYKLKKKG